MMLKILRLAESKYFHLSLFFDFIPLAFNYMTRFWVVYHGTKKIARIIPMKSWQRILLFISQSKISVFTLGWMTGRMMPGSFQAEDYYRVSNKYFSEFFVDSIRLEIEMMPIDKDQQIKSSCIKNFAEVTRWLELKNCSVWSKRRRPNRMTWRSNCTQNAHMTERKNHDL